MPTKLKEPGHIALKYLMCSNELAKIDALALKYLMCSNEAADLIKKGESVAVKYLMCSKDFEAIKP